VHVNISPNHEFHELMKDQFSYFLSHEMNKYLLVIRVIK
jgi:hypothetical protein